MKSIKIGGASGFWGEWQMATSQLLTVDGLNYVILDYLAEVTTSIMASARLKKPEAGHAHDFASRVVKPNLAAITENDVKIITNAGGLNPNRAAEEVREICREAGVSIKVAVIEGDDLYEQRDAFLNTDVREMFSGEEFPQEEKITSINAYLGAFPIVQALNDGAQIVITGRCVDSALTLGACIHEFDWGPKEWDKLAAGSLAGHILECGPQATGGNHTDWESIGSTLDNVGYPVAEIFSEGEFEVTKPENTGGIVSVGTVSEQLLYEIGDPQAYMLPDVICDFSQVCVTQVAENRVRVSGAIGHPCPNTYKVCLTYQDGYRAVALRTFYGEKSGEKSMHYARAIFRRCELALEQLKLDQFTETHSEILGLESQYGEFAKQSESREVVVKIAAKHPHIRGTEVLLKETDGMALGTPPGLSSFGAVRTRPSKVIRLYSFLAEKADINRHITVDGLPLALTPPAGKPMDPTTIIRPPAPEQPTLPRESVTAPLVRLAWARSGDKGDSANIGVIVRRAEWVPYVWHQLSCETVGRIFAHFMDSNSVVERFYCPGSNSINFVISNVLGGGGMSSLRNDPLGKGYSQLLLAAPIAVPKSLLDE